MYDSYNQTRTEARPTHGRVKNANTPLKKVEKILEKDLTKSKLEVDKTKCRVALHHAKA